MKTHILIQRKNNVTGFFEKSKILTFMLLCTLSTISINAQDNQSASTNATPQYKGDNFSLEGALAVFKKAKSVEQFEKMINDKSNNVNNLDLNNDGKTDYIAVNDITEDKSHILVLSTYVDKNKSQDIATINIEKSGDNIANVQIIGDPDLYPSITISEPVEYNGTIANDTYDATNKNNNNSRVSTTNNDRDNSSTNMASNNNGQYSQSVVNVWGWPIVQFMYNPYYSVWNSPYYWDYLPYSYVPWHPFLYSSFYLGCNRFHYYYKRTPVIRVNVSRNVYILKRGAEGYRQNFHNQNFNRSFSQRNLENRNSNFGATRMGGYTNHMSSGFGHAGGGGRRGRS